jgi:hypothetical protein
VRPTRRRSTVGATRRNTSEPLTPRLLALLTEMANTDPFDLTFSLHLAIQRQVGASPTKSRIASYFTPRQRKLLARQRAELQRYIDAEGRTVAHRKGRER